jgi:hypothetical protein
MNQKEKRAADLDRAAAWFCGLTDERKVEAFSNCLGWLMDSEYIGVRSEQEIVEEWENGEPARSYMTLKAPYLRSCGESIIQ